LIELKSVECIYYIGFKQFFTERTLAKHTLLKEIRMFKHILIATDGSELAERCVGQGLSLAQFLRCRVTVVTVTAPYSNSGIFGGMLDDDDIVVRYNQSWEKFASKVLGHAKDLANDLQVETDVVHLINPIPSDAISTAADSLRCDLIVVATHGYSGVQRLVLGSQTNEIITQAKTSVLVVR